MSDSNEHSLVTAKQARAQARKLVSVAESTRDAAVAAVATATATKAQRQREYDGARIRRMPPWPLP
jgi:hypothetical protein